MNVWKWTLAGMVAVLISAVPIASAVAQLPPPAAIRAAFDRLDAVIAGAGRAGEIDPEPLHAQVAFLSVFGMSPDTAADVVGAFVRVPSLTQAGVIRAAQLFPSFGLAMGWYPSFAAETLGQALDGNEFAFKQINDRLHVMLVADAYKMRLKFMSGDRAAAVQMMMNALVARFPAR